MRTSKDQIVNTRKNFEGELREALNYTSPDLTAEGIAKEREARAGRVRSKYAKEIDVHRGALYLDHDRSAFDQYRPKLDWNNAGAVAKARAKWEAVQTKLDAGLSIGQIIETADDSTLAAINEFWTDHAVAQQAAAMGRGQQYEAPDTTAVQRAVEDRAADLNGNTGRAALTKSRQANGLHAYADVTLGQLESIAGGRTNDFTDIYTALEANHAEQMAMSGGAGLIANNGPSDSADTGQEATVSE